MIGNCSKGFSFPNKTCADDQIWISTEEAIGMSILSSVSAIIGSLGNVLVIAAVITSRYLHTVPDFFILSLSIADLLITAIAQPMEIHLIFAYPLETKTSRDTLQVTSSFVGHLALLASITSITVVTLDRLIAIRFPLRYETWVTFRRSFMAIAALWFVSIAQALIYSLPEDVNRRALWGYVTTNLVVTITVYVYIFGVAKKHASTIVAVQPKSQQEARNQRGERKAAKTIAIIVGVFLLFWFPLIMFAGIHGSYASGEKFLRGFKWVKAVSMCNSAINPYVYCIRSKRFRLAIAKIIRLKNVDMTQSLTFA